MAEVKCNSILETQVDYRGEQPTPVCLMQIQGWLDRTARGS
jgi:hypothetical protein